MIIKKKYKEILLIKSFKKETSISCRNYEGIKFEKLEKKNTASYKEEKDVDALKKVYGQAKPMFDAIPNLKKNKVNLNYNSEAMVKKLQLT